MNNNINDNNGSNLSFITSEAVSEGHPDKICDQIADKVLDFCLKDDANSHVACEVFATNEYILLGGEITTKAKINYEKLVRDLLYQIGYKEPKIGIGYNTCKIDIKIKEQSQEINKAVNGINVEKICAGDQGIVFGYATNETKNYMPITICIANDIVKLASKLRKEGKFKYALPDMKTQVTINYKTNTIKNILISVQHEPNFEEKEFKEYIYHNILLVIAKKYGLNQDFDFLINPSGSFTIGGPKSDTGLTGRKLMCDTYGGIAHHGGGAFSGKDATKIDRCAAYYARYIAKNLVAAGIAKCLEIQIAYAIGRAQPIDISIFNCCELNYPEGIVYKIINQVFDAHVGKIIKKFSLNKPNFNYVDISVYGHFGRTDVKVPWEELDKVEEIKEILANIKNYQ